MKTLTPMCCRHRMAAHQRGLSLFIALIALAVISLASVALIRSVDTATVIAGNVSFKQSTVNSGEAALIEVSRWIGDRMANPATVVEMESNNTANGYYARETFSSNPASALPKLNDQATWVAGSRAAVVKDCGGALGDRDCSGNEIRYIVERMCRNAGPANTDHCLFGPGSDTTSSQGVKNDPDPRPSGTTSSVIYRVTARVLGPKDTVSYIQSFIY